MHPATSRSAWRRKPFAFDILDCIGTLTEVDKEYLAQISVRSSSDYKRVAELHIESAGFRWPPTSRRAGIGHSGLLRARVQSPAMSSLPLVSC
jgi:hypothetical protein